jgi:bifunctional DNA-binding transcriptional regulator/antitoxin component of YhaV-PrlF toxin-antitoxin module
MKITELDIIEITNQMEIGRFVIRRLNSEEFSVYVDGKIECTGNDEEVLEYINGQTDL